MPIADNDDHQPGHFKRAYDFLIKPACIKAGFNPIRADDVQKTNIIVVDLLHKIVTCDLALCDLSSRNPNVLYELGIRQAFDLPVTLIKDEVTSRIFDIQGFRDIEYKHTMRIDEVNSAIEQIAEALVVTFEQKNLKDNSIIALLSVTKATISEPINLSPEMSMIIESLNNINSKINNIESNMKHSNPRVFINDEELSSHTVDLHDGSVAKIGSTVYHPKFGKGVITNLEGIMGQIKIIIDFEDVGVKNLLAPFVKLYSKPIK